MHSPGQSLLGLLATCLLFASLARADDNAAVKPNERGEPISYLDNGRIRLGVNLNLGGAITYLADCQEAVNVVNSHDWGRQIQMSFYSGPNPFEPNGKKPSEHWRQLGWNPIQSGDYAGFRSKVLEHSNDGHQIHVRCIPMQWPLNNEPGECTFESWIRLEDNVAFVRCRLNNARTDTTQYQGRSQELPAIYTNGPWHRLVTYTGPAPYAGEEPVEIPKKTGGGFPWSRFVATERWTALLREDDTGLGVWTDGAYATLGGFAGKPGRGGPHDSPTGYISPLRNEILDHNITYEYRYQLILGSLSDIRRHAYAQERPEPAPRYVFSRDRRHWIYRDAVDAGWPIQGHLAVHPTGPKPRMLGPVGIWKTENLGRVFIRAAFPGATSPARLAWRSFDDERFQPSKSIAIDIESDDRLRTYAVDLGRVAGFHGTIVQIALELPKQHAESDPPDSTDQGQERSVNQRDQSGHSPSHDPTHARGFQPFRIESIVFDSRDAVEP